MTKRIFDVIASIIVLVITLPILLVSIIVIKLTSSGPVFFCQQRIGRFGKQFTLYKLRTMVYNPDKTNLWVSYYHDPRITKVGQWLRRFDIDEMPNLINVLLGDMSIVGPRPEDPIMFSRHFVKNKIIYSVRPGLTCIATLKFRDEAKMMTNANNAEQIYINKILPIKDKLNIEYASKQSFWLDLKIIFQTIKQIIIQKK